MFCVAQMTDEVVLLGRLDDAGYYQCIANNSVGMAVVTASIQFKTRCE